MSLFITFEGCEGFGKSTQARLLQEKLKSEGIDCVLTREPGGTEFGEKIAQILKWDDHDISPLAEVMLFNASRAELVSSLLRPALSSGRVVICDRYVDSTIVYQGAGRGLNLSTVRAVNTIAVQGLMPDLTILMDMPVEQGMHRKHGMKADRFELEGADFHRRVRQGYLDLAAIEKHRFTVVDASLPEADIARVIWETIQPRLASRSPIRP